MLVVWNISILKNIIKAQMRWWGFSQAQSYSDIDLMVSEIYPDKLVFGLADLHIIEDYWPWSAMSECSYYGDIDRCPALIDSYLVLKLLCKPQKDQGCDIVRWIELNHNISVLGVFFISIAKTFCNIFSIQSPSAVRFQIFHIYLRFPSCHLMSLSCYITVAWGSRSD